MPQWSRRQVLAGAVAAAAGVGVLGSACSRRGLPAVERLSLATGPAGAVYREMGAALAQVWNRVLGADVVRSIYTDAAVDNIRLLRTDEADLGFVNVDVVQDTDAPGLRALFRVFDSVVHLVVPQGSPVQRLEDLAGRRVAVGLPGSGTRFTCSRLLAAAGVEVQVVTLGQDEAAQALRSGEVEAAFSLTAMPTPALVSLIADAGAGYRFVDLGDVSARLIEEFPLEYLDVTISGAVYPGITSVSALAVPTLMLAHPTIGDDVAELLTRTVIEEVEALRELRPEAGQINVRTAVATSPVPLHPGAVAYFRWIKA